MDDETKGNAARRQTTIARRSRRSVEDDFMRTYTLEREQWVPAAPEDVFAFFSQARNLEKLTPKWLSFHMLTPDPVMEVGAHIEYQIGWRFVRLRWLTEITEWQPPHRFVDVQLRGPYKLWHHTHDFISERGCTTIRDSVRYALPFGPLGSMAHWLTVHRDLKAIFNYRAEQVAALFAASPTTAAMSH
jgi:ligand-binding SRPBCC domain-containing protein